MDFTIYEYHYKRVTLYINRYKEYSTRPFDGKVGDFSLCINGPEMAIARDVTEAHPPGRARPGLQLHAEQPLAILELVPQVPREAGPALGQVVRSGQGVHCTPGSDSNFVFSQLGF